MELQSSFDVLSRVVEQVESRGQQVRDIEVETDTAGRGELNVQMDVPVPLCPGTGESQSSATPETASLAEEDGLTVTYSLSDLFPAFDGTDRSITTRDRSVRVTGGRLVMTVDFCIDSEGAPDIVPSVDADAESSTTGDESASAGTELGQTDPAAPTADTEPAVSEDLETVRSSDVPPYEDTEYLEALYDSCDTFTEMSERIPMDVSAETVRRYMIEADVHNPTSYTTEQTNGASGEQSERDEEDGNEETSETPSASGSETLPDEQLIADGLGLPEDVHIEDVVDAVTESTAVYEVQRSLGLDHDCTRELLQQLNLMEFVLHRIDAPEKRSSENEVIRRIRQHSAKSA